MRKIKASFDTTPLIYFTKAGFQENLVKLFQIVIDSDVYREAVLNGIRKGFADALLLDKLVKQGKIEITSPQTDLTKYSTIYKLGFGELSTILLVKEGITDLAIIDDSYARKVAKTLGLKVHGSLFVLKYAVKKHEITPHEALQVLHKMIKKGFWLNPEIVTTFQKNLQKYQH